MSESEGNTIVGETAKVVGGTGRYEGATGGWKGSPEIMTGKPEPGKPAACRTTSGSITLKGE